MFLVRFIIRTFDDILSATQEVSLVFLLRRFISEISCKLYGCFIYLKLTFITTIINFLEMV